MVACVCVCERERERERESRKGRIDREPLRYDIFRITPGGDISPESLASSCFFHWRLIQDRFSTRGGLPHLGLTSKRHYCSLFTADCWLTALSDWPPTPWGWKLPLLYIFRTPTHTSFQRPTNAIHVAFPLSFVYLKITLTFCNPQTNRPVKGQHVTQICT